MGAVLSLYIKGYKICHPHFRNMGQSKGSIILGGWRDNEQIKYRRPFRGLIRLRNPSIVRDLQMTFKYADFIIAAEKKMHESENFLFCRRMPSGH